MSAKSEFKSSTSCYLFDGYYYLICYLEVGVERPFWKESNLSSGNTAKTFIDCLLVFFEFIERKGETKFLWTETLPERVSIFLGEIGLKSIY